jgi:hypothetical protein
MISNPVPGGGSNRLRGLAVGAVALILWAATAALGLVEIIFLRRIAMSIYGHFGDSESLALLISYIVVIIAGLLWVALAIGGAEYHNKNVGKPGSWTLFGWTVAIELLILILYFVV